VIRNFVYCIRLYLILPENTYIKFKPRKWALFSFWGCFKTNVIAVIIMINFNVIIIDYIVTLFICIVIEHVASNHNRLHLCCNHPMSDHGWKLRCRDEYWYFSMISHGSFWLHILYMDFDSWNIINGFFSLEFWSKNVIHLWVFIHWCELNKRYVWFGYSIQLNHLAKFHWQCPS